MLYKKDGQLFFKADVLPKKERDKPAYRAVYGIEAQAKQAYNGLIDKAMVRISQKLMSQYK